MEGRDKALIGVAVGCGMLALGAVCVGTGLALVMATRGSDHGPPPSLPPGIGGGASPDGGPSPFVPGNPPVLPPPPGTNGPSAAPPRVITATVTHVTGTKPVAEGALCAFTVEQATVNGAPGCHAQITCGGRSALRRRQLGLLPVHRLRAAAP